MSEVKTSDFDASEIEAAQVAAKGGEGSTETTTVAEPAATTAVAETTTTTETTTEKSTDTVNYAEWLANKSGGILQTEDDFVASLDKVKNYDSLEVKLKELETKVPTFKNDESKAWFDLVTSDEGKKALKDYIAEKDKDYATMSDIDVRREALQKEHPQWSKKDVDLELRHKYGKDLELKDTAGLDEDELEAAEAHNAQVERNLELLAVHARDDRYSLIEKQKLIELPKINKTEPAAQQQGLTEEEIADRSAKWVKSVDENLPKLANISVTIDDKEVVYVQTDDDKKQLTDKVKSFTWPEFLKSRKWLNDDGTGNPLNIAADLQKLDNFEKIIKSVAGQVKTTTTKEIMNKIKNIEPGGSGGNEGDPVFDSLEAAANNAKKKAGW